MDEFESRRALTAADGMVLAALTGLLFCVYLLTASLTFVSSDELFLFDATESFAKHRSVLLSETSDLVWPGEASSEPGLPLLAAPIYWLANGFSGVGNIHATLLFNPLITALTAALVFLYVRQLAFSRATAATVALAYGLTTIAWPYTKTFFREPLATFTLFASALCFLHWRDALGQHRSPARTTAWLLGALLAGLASLFTKESGLVGVPLLLLILWPKRQSFGRGPQTPRHGWRTAALIAVTLIVAVLGIWAFGKYFNGGRFDVIGRLPLMWRNRYILFQGLTGFLFSPGKSLFVYSPALVLALAAPFIGGRRWDASWPLIMLAVFVVMYSLVRGELWWGGTNWGPRYMVPLTPFLLVSAAPAIEKILHHKSWLAKAWLLLLAVLTAAGFAVQVGGVGVKLGDYDRVLGGAKVGGPWTLALWTPLYSPVLGHWRLLWNRPVDFAWLQAPPQGPAWIVPVMVGALVALFAACIWFGLTRPVRSRIMAAVAVGGFFATGALTWFSLRAIYYDQRFRGNEEALHQLNSALAAIDAPDPVIFLNNSAYFHFVLNYYKGPITWYTLALNPKELLAPDQLRPPPATDPRTLVNDDAYSVASWFARQHRTVFLVMERGPFTPDAVRPLEWWMTREFFYEGVQEFSPVVRLVQFSTETAPKNTDEPAHAVNYRLGSSITLVGWDAQPDAAPLRPGSVLDISTQWQALAPPEADYKIGTYLITPQGTVAQQVDIAPVDGFWPTSAWQAETIARHNVAFVIPKDLPPGFYEVWTLMYSPVDGARLSVQDASGTAVRDHIVLFTVEVTR